MLTLVSVISASECRLHKHFIDQGGINHSYKCIGTIPVCGPVGRWKKWGLFKWKEKHICIWLFNSNLERNKSTGRLHSVIIDQDCVIITSKKIGVDRFQWTSWNVIQWSSTTRLLFILYSSIALLETNSTILKSNH